MEILKNVIDTLKNISVLLDTFKLSDFITKIPGATAIVTSIVKSQSENAKNAASAFDTARQSYKGKECVVQIPTIKEIAIEEKKIAKAEKKAVEQKKKDAVAKSDSPAVVQNEEPDNDSSEDNSRLW